MPKREKGHYLFTKGLINKEGWIKKEFMTLKPQVFITGATGYIGGRLRRQLEDQGFPVRCLVRSKSSIPLNYPKSTQYIINDRRNPLIKALAGVEIAYFLIQSTESTGEIDRELAEQFAKAASIAKVKKIIYLGGLGNNYEMDLSPHLKSRQVVGHLLRAHSSGVQLIEFRVSIVIGSGSLSYDMIRSLVEKFPILFIPKWASNEAQPIAIQDLVTYLIRAIDCPLEGNPIFEIGGRDRLSYKDLMLEYARQKGLKRWVLPLPFTAPWLSSFWLAFATPLYMRVGRRLVESAISSTVVHDPLAAHIFEMKPIGYKEAIEQAIHNHDIPKTRWSDAFSVGVGIRDWSKVHFGGRLSSINQAIVPCSIEQAFAPIRKIGGKNGYYFANWIWKLRGMIDVAFGGVGFRRGRRDPEHLNSGDVIDFWRVINYQPNKQLKLLAEMITPGRSVLEYTVAPHKDGVEVTQKVTFDPIGVVGIIYWNVLYLPHCYLFKKSFKKMIKKMKEPA